MSNQGVLCSAGRESVSIVAQGRLRPVQSITWEEQSGSHGRKDQKEKKGWVGAL